MTGQSEPESWGLSGAAGSSGTGLLLAPGLRGSVTGFFPGSRGGPLVPESESGPWTMLDILEWTGWDLYLWGLGVIVPAGGLLTSFSR